MSSKRFYNIAETNTNDMEERNGQPSINNGNGNDEDDDDNEDDSEFLQDVQYSSTGSFDRSSIGSIPWADDAIKQNQMDWEQVERMLIGEEPLPTEPDLRNEILEWQEKFPQLLKKQFGTAATQQSLSQEKYESDKIDITHTLPDDLVSRLSLNSSDDDDRYDELDTPTADTQIVENYTQPQTSKRDKPRQTYADQLSAKLAVLRVTALPLRLSHRSVTNSTNAQLPQYTSREERGYGGTLKSLSSSKVSPSLPQTRSSPKQQLAYRMPPILNVVESKSRFRDMISHKSFVQLTHIESPHHTKSAAVIRQTDIISPQIRPQQPQLSKQMPFNRVAHPQRHHTAWQRPLIATRASNFFNNRNSIILPALNSQRLSAQQQQHLRNSTVTTSPSTGGADTRTNSLINSNSSSANLNFRSNHLADRFVSRWQQLNAANHGNVTSTGTISTGRSISAAIRHNPRSGSGYNEFYVKSFTNMGYNKHDSFK